MIRKAFGINSFRAEFYELLLETFRGLRDCRLFSDATFVALARKSNLRRWPVNTSSRKTDDAHIR